MRVIFFRDETDLENRLLVLEITDNFLSTAEEEALISTFGLPSQSDHYKLLRDQLIRFVEPESRSKIFALAVACLAAEIQHPMTQLTSETNFDAVLPANKRSVKTEIILNKRLEQLVANSWTCLFPNGAPSELINAYSEINEILFDSSLSLQNTSTAKNLAKSQFQNCENSIEQTNLLENLIRVFKDDDEVQAFAVDVLLSDKSNRDHRLDIFAALCKTSSVNTSFIDAAISNFDEIMPQPYFDEHVFKFLRQVSEKFSFGSALKVTEIAETIGISDTGIELITPTANIPQTKLTCFGTDLQRQLKQHINSLQNGIVNRSHLL